MDSIEALGELAKAGPHKYISRKRVGNRYVYVYPEDKKPRPEKKALGEPELAVRGKFELAIREGKFKGSFFAHVRVARTELSKHESDKSALVGELGEMAPGGKVKARTKKLESVLGKMVRKPKYKDASMLQDLTGARIVLNDVASVKSAVAKIKAKYKVIEEDNYIDTPQGDYRSHHLIIEHRGKAKEIQVRTGNQNTFADWAHDIYKPAKPEQEKAMRSNASEIETYSKKSADYYWAKDSGAGVNPPYPPPCTQTIRGAFGCLDFGVGS